MHPDTTGLWGDDGVDPLDTVGETFTVDTDAPTGGGTTVTFVMDEFSHHLIENNPLGANDIAIQPGQQYPNTAQNAGVDFFFGWKGPYLDVFTPDPWGNRYMSNVFGLYSDAATGEYNSTAVVCYSAGVNGQVQTPINQPVGTAPPGWVTSGDDFAVILSSFGPF